MLSRQLNSTNTGLVVLIKTFSGHRNCFLSPVAMDGKDGDGLKLENIWPIISSFDAVSSQITNKIAMVSSSW